MADVLEARVEGLDAVLRKLTAVKDAVRKKALRAGVTKASRLAAKAAKARAPKVSGALKKSITQKVKTTPKGAVLGRVGPKRGEVQPAKRPGRQGAVAARPTRYAHLVEKGTGPSPARGGATSRARPFLAPAWDEVKERAERIIADEVTAAVDKAARGGK